MAWRERLSRHFDRSKRKHKEEMEQETVVQTDIVQQEILTEKQEYVKKRHTKHELSIEEYCEQLIQSTKSLDQKKLEYEQVTAYLTDIQLIDQMSGEERENVEAVAMQLVALSADREEIRQENKALTQLQFRFMQLHEHEIADGIAHMQEQEAYQNAINGDIRTLEEEKVNLVYEEKFYLERLHNLRMIAVSAIFLAVIGAGITAFAYTQYIFDIFFVLLSIACALAIAGTAIFVKYRNVNYALAYCRKQQARAVQLLNKVKIKLVNNRATLDYLCQKYNVGSAHELEYMWEQYQYILDNEEKYKRSSKELTHYGNLLVKVLRNIGVHDADIWISQPEALVDPREMVEITHGLNTRRQRLREDMELDEDMMDLAISGIKDKLQKEPEQAVYVQRTLEPFRIRI